MMAISDSDVISLERLTISNEDNFDKWLIIIYSIIQHLKDNNTSITYINDLLEAAISRNQITEYIYDRTTNTNVSSSLLGSPITLTSLGYNYNNYTTNGLYYIPYIANKTVNQPKSYDNSVQPVVYNPLTVDCFLYVAAKDAYNVVQFAISKTIVSGSDTLIYTRTKSGNSTSSQWTEWIQYCTKQYVDDNFLNKVTTNPQTVAGKVTFTNNTTYAVVINPGGISVTGESLFKNKLYHKRDNKNGIIFDDTNDLLYKVEVVNNSKTVFKPVNYPLDRYRIDFAIKEESVYQEPLTIDYSNSICNINGTANYANYLNYANIKHTYKINGDNSDNLPISQKAVFDLYNYCETEYVKKTGTSFTGIVNHYDDIFLRNLTKGNVLRSAALRSPSNELNLQCQTITNLMSTSKHCEFYLEKEDAESTEYTVQKEMFSAESYTIVWDFAKSGNLYATTPQLVNDSYYILEIKYGTLYLYTDGTYKLLHNPEVTKGLQNNAVYTHTLYYDVYGDIEKTQPISRHNEYTIHITSGYETNGKVMLNASHYQMVLTKSNFKYLEILSNSTIKSGSYILDGSVITANSVVNGITYNLDEFVYGTKIVFNSRIANNSVLKAGTYVAYASDINGVRYPISKYLDNDIVIVGNTTTLNQGSMIKTGSTISKFSVINEQQIEEDFVVSGLIISIDSVINKGSIIKLGSYIADGSNINNYTTIDTYGIKVLNQCTLKPGSYLLKGSIITKNSRVNNYEYSIEEVLHINEDMYILYDSILMPGSYIIGGSKIAERSIVNEVIYNEDVIIKNTNYSGTIDYTYVTPRLYVRTYDNISGQTSPWKEYSYKTETENDVYIPSVWADKLKSLVKSYRVNDNDEIIRDMLSDIDIICNPNAAEKNISFELPYKLEYDENCVKVKQGDTIVSYVVGNNEGNDYFYLGNIQYSLTKVSNKYNTVIVADGLQISINVNTNEFYIPYRIDDEIKQESKSVAPIDEVETFTIDDVVYTLVKDSNGNYNSIVWTNSTGVQTTIVNNRRFVISGKTYTISLNSIVGPYIVINNNDEFVIGSTTYSLITNAVTGKYVKVTWGNNGNSSNITDEHFNISTVGYTIYDDLIKKDDLVDISIETSGKFVIPNKYTVKLDKTSNIVYTLTKNDSTFSEISFSDNINITNYDFTIPTNISNSGTYSIVDGTVVKKYGTKSSTTIKMYSTNISYQLSDTNILNGSTKIGEIIENGKIARFTGGLETNYLGDYIIDEKKVYKVVGNCTNTNAIVITIGNETYQTTTDDLIIRNAGIIDNDDITIEENYDTSNNGTYLKYGSYIVNKNSIYVGKVSSVTSSTTKVYINGSTYTVNGTAVVLNGKIIKIISSSSSNAGMYYINGTVTANTEILKIAGTYTVNSKQAIINDIVYTIKDKNIYLGSDTNDNSQIAGTYSNSLIKIGSNLYYIINDYIIKLEKVGTYSSKFVKINSITYYISSNTLQRLYGTIDRINVRGTNVNTVIKDKKFVLGEDGNTVEYTYDNSTNKIIWKEPISQIIEYNGTLFTIPENNLNSGRYFIKYDLTEGKVYKYVDEIVYDDRVSRYRFSVNGNYYYLTRESGVYTTVSWGSNIVDIIGGMLFTINGLGTFLIEKGKIYIFVDNISYNTVINRNMFTIGTGNNAIDYILEKNADDVYIKILWNEPTEVDIDINYTFTIPAGYLHFGNYTISGNKITISDGTNKGVYLCYDKIAIPNTIAYLIKTESIINNYRFILGTNTYDIDYNYSKLTFTTTLSILNNKFTIPSGLSNPGIYIISGNEVKLGNEIKGIISQPVEYSIYLDSDGKYANIASNIDNMGLITITSSNYNILNYPVISTPIDAYSIYGKYQFTNKDTTIFDGLSGYLYVNYSTTDISVNTIKVNFNDSSNSYVIYNQSNNNIVSEIETNNFIYNNFVIRRIGGVYQITFDYMLSKALNQYTGTSFIDIMNFTFDNVYKGKKTIRFESTYMLNSSCVIGSRTRTGLTKEGEFGDPLYDLGCIEFCEEFTAIRLRKRNVTTLENIKPNVAIKLTSTALYPEILQLDETGKEIYNSQLSLGTETAPFENLYIGASPIVISDKNYKTNISEIPSNILAKWKDVKWIRFKYVDAVEKKGNNSRYHTGVVAQDIEALFSDRDNIKQYGFFCKDEWDDVIDKEYITIPEFTDAFGNKHEETTKEVIKKVKEKGNRYSIRYEEIQAIENMYLRNEIELLKKEIELLKEKVLNMSKEIN